MKHLTQAQLEDLACEIIRFCSKWTLWRGTALYCGGKKYEWCEERAEFCGLNHVRVTEGVRPEDEDNMALQELLELEAQDRERTVLYLTGELGDLLGGPGEYTAEFSALSREAQVELLADEELLGDLADALPVDFGASSLDPIEFDSRETYLELESEMQAARVEKAIVRLSRERIECDGGALPRHIVRDFEALIGKYGLNWSGVWGAASCRYDEREAKR